MFSGIIEKLGKVIDTSRTSDSLKIRVQTGYPDLENGESVAVNGVCLTVAERTNEGEAFFFLSQETLDRSNLGSITKGTLLNLERALTLQTRLSGHWVQGHVDGKSKLLEVISHSESHALQFEIPLSVSRYCVEKGSITLNGISLTINSIRETADRAEIGIMIIPHTWTHTNLSQLKAGDEVNVEVDILAKYVERLSTHRLERVCNTR
jgi:riboflavin synthase